MRLLVIVAVAATAACRGATPDRSPPGDSAFAAVQRRGRDVMGVDQYASRHVFESLPDGGRIVLERADSADTAAIAAVHDFLAFQRADHHAAGHEMH